MNEPCQTAQFDTVSFGKIYSTNIGALFEYNLGNSKFFTLIFKDKPVYSGGIYMTTGQGKTLSETSSA